MNESTRRGRTALCRVAVRERLFPKQQAAYGYCQDLQGKSGKVRKRMAEDKGKGY